MPGPQHGMMGPPSSGQMLPPGSSEAAMHQQHMYRPPHYQQIQQPHPHSG